MVNGLMTSTLLCFLGFVAGENASEAPDLED
jgi:hypothetical protein